MSEELVQSLKEKVRQQARRLSALEQYRLLCEQRVKELSPDHPLPVLPDHLGTPSPLAIQLHRALQQVERLQQEHTPTFGGEQQLLQERTELEAQLRSEVLHSEEQRALIESLKQALEIRVGKVANDAGVLAAFTQAQAEADQSKREAARLQAALTTQLTAHQQALERLQREETLQAEGLQQELSNVMYEKEAVEQDLATLRVQFQETENEADTLKAEVERLRGVQVQLKDSEQLAVQLSQQRERLMTETSMQQTQASQRAADLEVAQARISQLIQDLSSCKDQSRTLKSALEAAQKEVDSLTAEKRSLSAAVEQVRQEMAAVQAERGFFQNALNATKQEVGQREAAEFKSRGEVAELKKALQTLWEGSEAAARSAQARDNELSSHIAALTTSKSQLEVLLAREKEVHSQLQAEAKERLARLQTEHRGEVQDFEKARDRALREVQGNLENAERDISRLDERLAAREQELETAQSEAEAVRLKAKKLEAALQQSEESKVVALRELEETRTQLSAARAQLAEYETRSGQLEEAVGEIAEDHQRSKQESEALQQQLSLENSQLKAQLDSIHADLEALREDVLLTNEALATARAKERTASERAADLQQEVKSATATLRSEMALLQAQLALPSTDSRSLLDLVACLPLVGEALRSRLTADQRTMQNLQGQVTEAEAAKEKMTRNFVALEKSSSRNREESLASEVRMLREQLAAQQIQHLHSLRKRKDKLEACETQRQAAREEADQLLTRLRTLADNYEDLSRASALLEASVQPLESRIARKDGQRRRVERLLSLGLAALPVCESRRILAEAAETCAQLGSAEAEREEAELRIAELEQELGLEAQKLQVAERSAQLRLAAECETLELRLAALEQDLLQTKTAPAALTAKSAPKLNAGPLPSLTRYDPRISPLLSDTIEVRLTERLMQTAPNTTR